MSVIVETNITKRWEEGTPHHPHSEELFNALARIDLEFGGDYFCWKSGGDGDNGEHLMYEMDIHFETLDAEATNAQEDKPLGAPIAAEYAAQLAMLSTNAEALQAQYERGLKDGVQQAQGVPPLEQLTQVQQPIETIKYWLNAYSNPESGAHFTGHGMVVVMLREYLQLREHLAAAPQAEPKLTKEARIGGTTFGIGVPERFVVEAAQRAAEHPQGLVAKEVVEDFQRLIQENAERAAFLEAHPAVTKELCDLIEENERLKSIAEQAPQAAPEPEHVCATPKEHAAVDASLGLVALPTIRVSSTTHGLLEKFAALDGRIVPAVARNLIETAMTAPAPQALTDEQVVAALEDEARRQNGGTLDGLTMNKEMLSEVIKIFRVAERAHGISAATAGGQP